ncbi:MAG: translation initiation factor IF-3 [Candidatus Gracilibacteria bacterium]|nr:translation initiation factor IF-3 [Candidatus Gracilibacteria bacterium]
MKNFLKNNEIRAREVRVIDSDGEQLGVLTTSGALKKAQESGLDLIEVSPNAVPPVCKIDDFGSFIFNKKKAEKKQKQATKQAILKSVRFGIRISKHDMDVKISQIRKFIEKGHPVKLILQFRGREAMHEEFGMEKMKAFTGALEDISTLESKPRKQGNRIQVILRPEKPKKQ